MVQILSKRQFSVTVGTDTTDIASLDYGVPQGPGLGPISLPLYMLLQYNLFQSLFLNKLLLHAVEILFYLSEKISLCYMKLYFTVLAWLVSVKC